MSTQIHKFKHSLTASVLIAFYAVFAFETYAFAAPQARTLTELYRDLSQNDTENSAQIEQEIRFLWRQSGSPSVDLVLKKANDAFARSEFEIAADHFTAVTEFAPDFATGFFGRAQAYIALGAYGPAIEDLQKTLSLDPNYFDAIASLGQLFQLMGQDELAIRAYDQVLTIHPHFDAIIKARDELIQPTKDLAL